MNYRKAVKEAEERLFRAEIADAAADAWYLLEYAIRQTCKEERDRTWYLMHREEEMPEMLWQAYQNLLQRRAAHIPLQHLTGEQEFFGFSFLVNEHVLIPRQDTEILVEEALKQIKAGMRLLDLCTGSGCILLSILKSVEHVTGMGADLSEKALETARRNARRLQVETMFQKSDLFSDITGRFDMIVSNPPYIAAAEVDTLMPEVRLHEPRMALDGKEDGLYYYRNIIAQSPSYLKEGGILLFEIGYDQGEAVSKMLADVGFSEVCVIRDLAGLDRVVKGIWKNLC